MLNLQDYGSGGGIETPVAIADGGTSATSAADARTALGVAAASHTHASSPTWQKFTIDYTDMDLSEVETSITVTTLAARSFVHGVVLKTTEAFSGPDIMDLVTTIGEDTVSTDWLNSSVALRSAVDESNFNYAGPGNSKFQTGASFEDNIVVKLYLICTGANLDTLTAGSLDIWLLVSQLPA